MTCVDVAVVGAGPVGLTAAMALAEHGISPVVFERHAHVVNHPRGHVINVRSMEILRRWGLDTSVMRYALDPATKRRISWATSLVGEELARLDTPATPSDVSPTRDVSCPQDRVEEILLAALRDRGVDVRYGNEVTLSSSSDGTVLTTTAGDRVEARYVIAADGASSPVRHDLGISMSGPPVLGHQVNIYFEADMSEMLRERDALLTWILNPTAPGVFINMGEGRRWVFNLGYDPEHTAKEAFNAELCQSLLRAAIGIDIQPAVRTVRFWRIAAQVADTYRRGGVFLCGDAAHRFPPTGGLGANTGIGDAQNLAWKLAHVLGGSAEPPLLDSYEAERRPVAIANTAWSLANSRNITDTGVGPMAAANGSVLAENGPDAEALRERIRSAVDDQLEHFDHLGQDLGYIYQPSQIVRTDPTPPPESDGDTYRATTHPGARLPHVTLNDGRSTIDLIGTNYRLITSTNPAIPDVAHELVDVGQIDPDTWSKLPQPDDVVGLLVRPDGHIAARFRDFGPHDLAVIESITTCIPLAVSTG